MAVDLRNINRIDRHNQLIVCGFVRTSSNGHVPDAIFQLCILFYGNGSNSYVWQIKDKALLNKIKNAKVCQYFHSPVFTMHGFKWYLQLWPNGDTKRKGKVLIFAVLPSMPPKIDTIALHRKYSFFEADIHHNYDCTMKNTPKMHVITWPNKSLLFKELQKYETLSFGVEMDIWNLYGKDGDDLTKEWLLYHGKSQNMKVWIQSLTIKMNDIMWRLEDIEKRVGKKKKKMIKKVDKLQKWLNEIGLMQYYDVLVANGFDNMNTVRLLEQSDLSQIGIEKIGHQLKFMAEIRKL